VDIIENEKQYLMESLLQEGNPFNFLKEKAGDSYQLVFEDLQCAILLKTIRKKVLFQQYFRSRKSGLTAIWTEKSMRLISIVYIITILM